MMLAVALMLLQGAPDGPPDEDLTEVQEITVIAQKLRQIQVGVSRDAQGKYQCGVSETTGLVKLDAELCRATTNCLRKGKESQEDLRACVEKAKPSMMTRIHDYLREERAGAGA